MTTTTIGTHGRMPGLPRYLTTAEVAAHLHQAEKTLASWRALAKGPRFVKFGAKSVRYSIDDLTSGAGSTASPRHTGTGWRQSGASRARTAARSRARSDRRGRHGTRLEWLQSKETR